MSALQGEKYGGYLLEENAAVVKGGDGVFKGGQLGVADDDVDFRIFALDPLLDGREEMLVLDEVEGRDIKGRLVRFEKGIVGWRRGGLGLLHGCGGWKEGNAKDENQPKEKNPGGEIFHGVIKPPE
jgi:hypothetical protein